MELADTLNLWISDKIKHIFKGQQVKHNYVSVFYSDLEYQFRLLPFFLIIRHFAIIAHIFS